MPLEVVAHDGLHLLGAQFTEDPQRLLKPPPPEEAADRVGLVDVAVAL